MKAFIKSFVAMFAEAPVAAPVKPTWEKRLSAAEAAIDRALLRDHGKTPLLTKAETAARLRKQIKESCARRAESVAAAVESSIRSFERAGCC